MPVPVPLSAPGIWAPSLSALIPGPSLPLRAAKFLWFASKSAAALPGKFVGPTLVGNPTSESAEVSFTLTASWCVSLARTLGARSSTGLGGGGAASVFVFGTVLSKEPVSSLPVLGAGGIGTPSLGGVR